MLHRCPLDSFAEEQNRIAVDFVLKSFFIVFLKVVSRSLKYILEAAQVQKKPLSWEG